jgi:signal transduction histidine kinase
VYGQKFTCILLADVAPENFDQILVNGLNGEMQGTYELPIRVKNGSLIMVLLSSTPRLSVTGDVIGLTLVGQDVTELIEYRTDLEKKVEKRTHELHLALQKEKELVEMKSRFVSIASHEFRTPLSTVSLASGFIKKFRNRMSPEEIDKKLVSIETEVSHMASLLADILTIGKGEAGKIEVNWKSIPVGFFFKNLAQQVVESTQKSHRVNLKLHCPFECFQTDEGLIRNIVINLLNNAIKFSPHQDEIELTVTGSQAEIIIRVRDFGIGIPPEDASKLFEPFYRATNVAAISGTGLGLSIVKKAVDLLGGEVKVPRVLGPGTEFLVTLPIKNGKENTHC